jgi:hypothetical protein
VVVGVLLLLDEELLMFVGWYSEGGADVDDLDEYVV